MARASRASEAPSSQIPPRRHVDRRRRASRLRSRAFDPEARELPVQRRRIDTEHLGGARLVTAFGLQHPEDVRTLHGFERRIRRRARGNERLRLSLRHALRERADGYLAARRENGRALEGILELADVAGPLILLQDLERAGSERLQRLRAYLGDPMEKMLDENRDVVGTLAE